jgi:hypothetical protein
MMPRIFEFGTMVEAKTHLARGAPNFRLLSFRASIHVPHIKLIGALLVLSVAVPAGQSVRSRPELWAFTGPWDPLSDASLRKNATQLNVAVTGWIALDSVTAQPVHPPLFADTIRLAGAVRRMAIVTSWHGDRFHPNTIRALARDDARLAQAAGAIAAHASTMRYAGLVLDFEALERADLAALLRVVTAITDSAHGRRISPIVVAIPAVLALGALLALSVRGAAPPGLHLRRLA